MRELAAGFYCSNDWLADPLPDIRCCFSDWHGGGHDAGMCNETKVAADDDPRNADDVLPIQTVFPPCLRLGMFWGLLVVGVDEQVDIRNDHRLSLTWIEVLGNCRSRVRRRVGSDGRDRCLAGMVMNVA